MRLAQATWSGQRDPEELDSFAVCRVHDQFLGLPLVLGQIGLKPASVPNKRRHAVGFVSGVLRVGEEAYRPSSSPTRPALFKRRLKREQQPARFGGCIDLVSLSYDKNSFASVINSDDFSRVVALTTFCGRALRNNPGYGKESQSHRRQILFTGSQS